MVLWIKTCYISDFNHHLTFMILSFSSSKKRKFYLINSEVLSSFDTTLFCGLWKEAQISLCYKTSLFGPFHICTLNFYKLATWKSRFFLPHKTGIPSHSDECDLQVFMWVWFIDCEERAPASPHIRCEPGPFPGKQCGAPISGSSLLSSPISQVGPDLSRGLGHLSLFYLYFFDHAGSSLLSSGFLSLVVVNGGYSSLWCSGFCYCRAQAAGLPAQ